MICVEVVNGVVVAVDPQPVDITGCGLVISDGAQMVSPFVMSIADGALIGASVALAWAIAWGFRLLVQATNVGG